MIERRFETWDYHTSQQIEDYCSKLQILPNSQAMAFFMKEENLVKKDLKVVERKKGSVFESLSGFVSSSDRHDFIITYDFLINSPLQGLLMLETFNDAFGILFCVARISESLFLTYGFTQSQKAAIICLSNCMPRSESY